MKRVDQHKSQVYNNMSNSTLNIHHGICNNPIQWNRSSILYKSNNYIERNILESACIEFSKEVNINTSQGLYKIDPICLHIISQQYKLADIL